MDRIRVMSVFGTRPEAIKMAPLVLELARRPEFESICCLSGQSNTMAQATSSATTAAVRMIRFLSCFPVSFISDAV